MSEEEWRDVPGYEGHYRVSSRGRVYSLPGKKWKNGKIVKPIYHKSRHYQAHLTKDGRSQMVCIHRLVAIAFLGVPEPDHEVCHRNGDGLDNRVENLYWGTRSQNMQDVVKHGRHVHRNKTHCPRKHPLVDPNLTVSGKKDGRRRCLACARMRNYVRNHTTRNGETFTTEDEQQISDQYFQLIQKGIHNVRRYAA